MAQIRLRIVGECLIEVAGKSITPTSPQLFALLLYLGIEHNRKVPRAELLELLYPASDQIGDASHRLRQSLYKLKVIGAPIIFGDGTIQVEAKQVSSVVSELISGGPEIRRERLSKSFEILPHYAPPPSTAISEWVEQLREKLHNALRQHLTRDMDIARRKADWRYLEAIARRTLALDPLNESAVLGLAEATARTGSKARAVSILDAYRTELGEERANLALPASLLEKRIEASRDRVPISRREPIPLIGRERELESLLSQWQSARRGSAHLLWLTGNKSVGKSRLAEELATSVLIAGSGQVVSFSMSPLEVGRPLSLVAALANRLSSLPGAAGCDPASLQALGKLSGSISLPSAVNPDNRNSTYSDVAVRDALCDLLACVSDERPVLIIIDDAQHLDEASAELLGAVLKRVVNKRFLALLCGIVDSPLMNNQQSTLHLEPLSPSASQELWQCLLSALESELPESVSKKCQDTAGGNPGYLELLAQQAVQDPQQFQIPADLITLTDRRLSQLSLQARYALEAIVILDDVATATSIAYLTGLATYDLLTALQALESGDLIVSTQSGVRCRSGLIVERVRATSSGTVASIMEARAAEHLEKEQSGERWSPSTAWRIASHWRRAGEPRRARAYLRACWQHAVSVGRPTKACVAINEALLASSDPEDRASLLDDLIGASQAAGDIKAVTAAVRERTLLSARVHDSPARTAQLSFDADEVNWTRNLRPAVSLDSFRAHLESSLLNSNRRVRAARILMMVADGDLDASLASYTISACRKIAPGDTHSALLLLYVSLIYHTTFGDAGQALRIADEIQEQTRKIERSSYALTFERNCVFARQLVGVDATDYESFERGFAQALDASMTPVALWMAGSLMSVLVDDGDLAGAQKWMASAEQLAESFAAEDWPIEYLGAQIDIALLMGDYHKARRYLEIIETCARYQSKRVRNDLYIYRLRVLQFSGESWSPDEHLVALLTFHEIGKHLTRHDDHMEVLWQTLRAVGQPQRASDLLSEYLRHHRRERRPCRYMLRVRTNSDPAWNQLSDASSIVAPVTSTWARASLP
jgi:DNA-binding SARP family transcriptional activator